MSKCNKVKNPCKICLGAVSQKNGLQCQGACQNWVHYSCLNYTPGKIKDIKAGIIKVTCPCPDCKTTLPKEYRTDQPYSCTNSQCPANRSPTCDNQMCPINETRGNVPYKPTCPLSKCGDDCKTYSTPQLPPCPPATQCVSGRPIQKYPSNSSSDACLSDAKCPSGCSSINGPEVFQMGVDSGMPSFHVVERMCTTVGQLTNQINELMCKMKQVVKIKEGSQSGCGSKNQACHQNGPKSLCPKPCFCPGNPARRQ